jgi:hypothetical protein
VRHGRIEGVNRASWVALAALALGGLVWLATVESSTSTEGLEAGATVSGREDDGHFARNGVAPAAERRAHDRAATPSPASKTSTLTEGATEPPSGSSPPRGTLRIAGRVLVGENEPLPAVDALVRVYRRTPSVTGSVFLGTARVRDGKFAYDLPNVIALRVSALGAGAESIELLLSAPGYESTSEAVDIASTDGVETVTIVTEVAELLVVGRVVDARGRPIAGTGITLVEFEPRGTEVGSHEAECDDVGHFQLSLRGRGSVEVVARHPAHGLGQKTGRSDEHSSLLDLGDIVVNPRGIVSGRLIGCGVAPLTGHSIKLEPVIDDKIHSSHVVWTDDAGRFSFACLDRISYRVHIENVEVPDEQRPVVTPDVTDMTLEALFPSARVTIVGPAGIAVERVFICVRPVSRVDGKWRAGEAEDVELHESQVEVGVFDVVFSQPGTFSFASATSIEGTRWSGVAIIEIGLEHRDLQLQLAPERRHEVKIIATHPNGTPLPAYEATFVDPATGLTAARSTERRPRVNLASRTWDVRVEPKGGSYAIAFDAEVSVDADTRELHLRAVAIGGLVTVRGLFATPTTDSATVYVVRPGGPLVALELKPGKDVTSHAALPCGDYEVVLATDYLGISRDEEDSWPGARRPEVRSPVSIRAGETTWLQLEVP